MTDLPRCRLCKCEPYIFSEDTCECPTPDCIPGVFTQEQWRKLMYVPERKPPACGIRAQHYFDRGYNAAIDDMEKGGER